MGLQAKRARFYSIRRRDRVSTRIRKQYAHHPDFIGVATGLTLTTEGGMRRVFGTGAVFLTPYKDGEPKNG